MDVLKIHPSGRVVASYDTSKRAKPGSLLPLRQSQVWAPLEAPIDRDARMLAVLGARIGSGEGGPDPLGLSSVPKSSKPRKIRGSGGITPAGRMRVKDAATLLEESAPAGTMALWTVTVPPGLEEKTIESWARITHNIRNTLRRDLLARGLPGEVVFVSEYQESREAKYGKPVLHLHFLFQGALCNNRWKYTCEHYRQRWEQCLRNVCGNAASTADYSASSRVEKVRKSCAAYLGKYMSKGCSGHSGDDDEVQNRRNPSAWYGLSQNLLGRVVRSIRRLRGPIAARTISYLLANAATLCRYNRWVSFVGDGGAPIWIGWYGDLKDRHLLDPITAC
jgi:hypothetical protein